MRSSAPTRYAWPRVASRPASRGVRRTERRAAAQQQRCDDGAALQEALLRADVLVVDGTSLAHRARSAARRGLYGGDEAAGFQALLGELSRACGAPEHVAVALDPGPKARPTKSKQRGPPRGTSARSGWAHLHPAVEAAGAELVGEVVPGAEADDAVAAVVAAALAAGDARIAVASADRDVAQLLALCEERVAWLRLDHATRKNPAGLRVLRAEDFRRETGVDAEAWPEFLALVGKGNEDFHAGVPGVGERKAKSLLRRFGTVETLLDAAAAGDALDAGVAAALNAHAHAARAGARHYRLDASAAEPPPRLKAWLEVQKST